jgi:hypothetical protein
MNIIRRWGRRVPRPRKIDPFSLPPETPRPARANDRVVFHSNGWHYGPCSNVRDDCVLPRRTDVLVRNAVFDSGLTLVVDEPVPTEKENA